MDKKQYVPIIQVTGSSSIKDKLRIAEDLDKEFGLGLTPVVANQSPAYIKNLRALVPENFCVYPDGLSLRIN